MLTIGLALLLPYLAILLTIAVAHFTPLVPLAPTRRTLLPWLYVQHGFQLMLALIAIAFMHRRVPADYGLHLPRGKSYALPALALGASISLVWSLIVYAPQIAAHSLPSLGYPLTAANVAGWLAFEGIYVGPTEEILFRALLITYLVTRMPGDVKIGSLRLSVAAIVVSAIFALGHASSFWTSPLWIAACQQFFAFVLGVSYAYWFERSRSVVAPIIGHNASDLVAQLLTFAAVAFWR